MADTDPREFSPPLLRLQGQAPAVQGRRVLWTLLALVASVLAWAALGRVEVVAVAEGRLVPASYVKIVQPAEAGIVRDILVREGQAVTAGQVLMRMDAAYSDADTRSLETEQARKRLAALRVEAELAGAPMRVPGDWPAAMLAEAQAQYAANRAALDAALAEERARGGKARGELAASELLRDKLGQVLPHYREQDAAYGRLARDGFVGPLMAGEKHRERIEKEEEYRVQEHIIASSRAAVEESGRHLEQIERDYQRRLHAERQALQADLERLESELAKQAHRKSMLELRAPQAGQVKDLATHTAGAVVQPGVVLMTLVPQGDELRAEVWVGNEDIGFVREGQAAKLKLMAFPFQKYGLLPATVEHVSADAQESQRGGAEPVPGRVAPQSYRALLRLGAPRLAEGGEEHALAAGMHATAEILLGHRSVLDYLLSPLRGAFHDAGRER